MILPVRVYIRRDGSALIICLTLIVIICIALVGFVATARTERQTASSHFAAQTAGLYAGMSSDVVSARLLTAMEKGSQSGYFWASGPGRIVVVDRQQDPLDARSVPLYSGEVDSTTVTPDLSVDLNPASLTGGSGLMMSDASVVMPQKWLYIRKDGTQEQPSSVPHYDKTNPVVGRYAFWTDDLSARLNWNTAAGRVAASGQPVGHPSQVDLTSISSITDADTAELKAERTTGGAFNTPDEVRQVEATAASIATAALAYPFDFTHYNHAPSGVNLFGDPRIALTTQASRAGEGNVDFLDILKTANANPALLANISNTKVEALFSKIYSQLSRTDWPQFEGVSFVDKYGAHNTAQIILNLIDYVRSAESSDRIVEPLRGTFNAATGAFTQNATSSLDALVGNSRRPIITEVGIYVPAAPVTVNAGEPGEKKVYHCQVYVELYWPEHSGGSIDLTADCTLHVGAIDDPGKAANEGIIPATRIQGNSVMNPGDYRVVAWPMDADAKANGDPPSPMYVRAVVSKRRPGTTQSDARLDIVPPVTGKGNIMEYIPVRGAPAGAISSISTDDPFVNRHRDDWRPGTNTFGAANSNTLETATTMVPPQDTDAGGKIASFSVRLPNANQPVQSLTELGRIHTGIRGRVAGAGTPWRTVRLQPDDTPNQLPDWVLFDLFQVPAGDDNDDAAVYPVKDAVGKVIAKGGQVNLNADLQPFASSSDPERTLPLMAALKGAANGSGGTISSIQAKQIAENIANATLADKGRRYSPPGTYLYPGEVVEVKDLADGGESREVLVGEVIDLLTARGNTYAVYSVGQSIRQAPGGSISVTAEKRTLTILEIRKGAVRVVYQQEMGL